MMIKKWKYNKNKNKKYFLLFKIEVGEDACIRCNKSGCMEGLLWNKI